MVRRSRATSARALCATTVAVAAGLVVVPAAAAAQPVSAPSVSKLSVAHGALNGNMTVVIKGKGLAHVRSVLFGKSRAKVVKNTAGSITVKDPRHTEGRVDVRVVTAEGRSRVVVADRFTYVGPPVITHLDPSVGPIQGGNRVTVTGRNLFKVSLVRFGTVAGTSVKADAAGTHVTVTAPTHGAGLAEITVVTHYGTSADVSVGHYSYVAVPVITTSSLPNAVTGQSYSAALTADVAGTWSITTGTLPAGLSLAGATISGTPTTAVTDTFTVALTDVYGQTTTAALTLVVVDGTGWVGLAPTVNDADFPDASLASVACGAAGVCAAYGTYSGALHGFHSTNLVMGLSDNTWTPATIPLPANANTADPNQWLSSITCSGSVCVAAGGYIDSTPANGGVGTGRGLIDTFAHGTWTAAEAATPSDAATDPDIHLESVTCADPSGCVAAGTYTNASFRPAPLIEAQVNGTWTVQPTPTTAGTENVAVNDLESVACTPAGTCVASDSDAGALLARTAGTWSAVLAPTPTSTNTLDTVNGVACLTATCMAVGTYRNSDGFTVGLIDTLSGGSWSPAAAPLPANAYASPNVAFTGFRCGPAAACIATGTYTVSDGSGGRFADTYIGGSWHSSEAPLPADMNSPVEQDSADLWQGACPTADRCLDAGSYESTTTYTVPSIYTYAASSATVLSPPTPAALGSASAEQTLADLACDSAGACVAVGNYYLPGVGSSGALIETHIPFN